MTAVMAKAALWAAFLRPGRQKDSRCLFYEDTLRLTGNAWKFGKNVKNFM